MSLLINECSICFENFKNSDEIYSTSCGHIYHFNCMQQWQQNGTECPECRRVRPTTHKIFLTLENIHQENPEKIEELKLQLQTANESNSRLHDQINDVELNFMQLQEQFTAQEEENKNLKERINQMNDSEANFMHLQKQYTESTDFVKYLEEQIKELQQQKINLEEKIKELQQQNKHSDKSSENIRELENKIQELTVQNEQQTLEMRLKCSEIESLKNASEIKKSTISDISLNGRIHILEQKLKYISTELEKEIANSSKLKIDNMKLQSTIENLTKPEERNKKQPTKVNKNKSIQNKENVKNDNTNSNQPNKVTSTKILIKDLPVSELTVPLENIIVNLASKMNVIVSTEDIAQIELVENNNKKSSQIQLMVEFKNLQVKNEFVAKKNNLKNFPTTNSIVIGEYMDGELHALLMYAKEKLKNIGFDCVFCKNNTIFAKKHRNHRIAIKINDKAHVDSLLKRKESVDHVTKDVDEATENTVDENYYQL